MRLPIHRKFITRFALVCFAIVILFPDVFIDLFIEFVHFLFDSLSELLHIVFELIESTLDKIVEHLFHTDLETTQVIVFYLMLISGIYIGYRLLRLLPPFCKQCTQNLLNTCSLYKIRITAYWHSLTVAEKFKLVGIFVLGLYLITLVSF